MNRTTILLLIAALMVPYAAWSQDVQSNTTTYGEAATPAVGMGPHLEGREFNGTLSTAGGPSNYHETVSFKDGQLYSSHFEKFGFSGVPYVESYSGAGVTTFKAAETNSDGEVMVWQGNLENGTMSAAVNYTDKNGTMTNYMFK